MSVYNSTALHVAAKGDGAELLSRLHVSADVNAVYDEGDTPLHVAVRNDNLDIIMLLDLNSTDVDLVNSQGETPLLTAVKQKHKEFVQLLLRKGARVDVRDERCPTTPLHYAADHKLLDIVSLLIPHCKNINVRNEKGETALHIAARKCYEKCVMLLLDNGANVDLEDHNGQTPLHCSVKQQNLKIATLIVSRSSNVNAIDNIGDSPLHVAVKVNDVECVKLLLNYGADVNINDELRGNSECKNKNARLMFKSGTVFSSTYTIGGTPLHIAVKGNRSEIVRLLLKNGANVGAKDRRGWTPLHYFSPHCIEISELLMLHGADVNATRERGETVLHVMAKGHLWDDTSTCFVKLLLRNGADVNACDQTGANPLQYATKHWPPETLRLLIDSTNVNSTDNCGETPLHAAAKESWAAGIHVLLQNGAQINAVNSRGETPLHVAIRKSTYDSCMSGYEYSSNDRAGDNLTKVIEFLLENGAEIDAGNEHGHTGLHYAVSAGYEKVAEVITGRGGKVNAKTHNSLTPLHIAACTGLDSLAEFLLKNGANVNAVSHDGNLGNLRELLEKKSRVKAIDFFDGGNLTPLHMAVMAGKDKIVKLVLEHGANVDAPDKNGNTPLYIAAKYSRRAIVEHILRRCPDVDNESNRQSVKAAVNSCKVDRFQSDCTRFRDDAIIVDLLFKYGFTFAPEDMDDIALLRTAVERGHLRFVEEMLKCNSDTSILNLPDQKLVTPLHIAAKRGHEGMVALLLSSGAYVNAVDGDGNTPLFCTTDLNIAKLLLNENANAENCLSILCAAIKNNSSDVVDMLFQNGAYVNAQNKDGMTALHMAFSSSNEEILKLLHKWGAVVELRDTENG